MSASLPVPGAESTQDATNQSRADTEASDGRAALRDAIVRLVDVTGLTPFEVEDWRMDEFVGGLIKAGYRRVSEDDDTIERVARALWRDAVADMHMPDTEANWAVASANGAFQSAARAAVRALREGE